MREAVRSGRRENYYTTENSFIDHYAKDAGLVAFAVYHVLERYANRGTQSTFVKTSTIAKLLAVHVRTVQRALKSLESLRLIRIVRNEMQTIYYVMPVPPKPRSATIPLFDLIGDNEFTIDDTVVAPTTVGSHHATFVSLETTSAPSVRDTSDAAYKEEQNLFDKTFEQEKEVSNFQTEPAYKPSGLPTDSFSSALQSARRIMSVLALPATPGNLTKVSAAIAAEVDHTGQSPKEVAEFITRNALKDQERGIHIDGFYFEGAKWRQRSRSNARSKAEQRKLDNLEVNARIQRELRERFGGAS